MAPRPRPQGGRQPRQQQPQVLSNLQSLLLHAAPTLPQYSQLGELDHPSSSSGGGAYFTLQDLWQSFEAWSAYGCEVPMRINVDGVWQEIIQCYTPYLSGIQLFGADHVRRIPADAATRASSATASGYCSEAEEEDGLEGEAASCTSSSAYTGSTCSSSRASSTASTASTTGDSDGEEPCKDSPTCGAGPPAFDRPSAARLHQQQRSAERGSVLQKQRSLGAAHASRPPLFEFSEAQRPHLRAPLHDQIMELAESFPGLLTLDTRDLHPTSWFAVSWVPIYRMPGVPDPAASRDLQANFLTFHSLAVVGGGAAAQRLQHGAAGPAAVSSDPCSLAPMPPMLDPVGAAAVAWRTEVARQQMLAGALSAMAVSQHKAAVAAAKAAAAAAEADSPSGRGSGVAVLARRLAAASLDCTQAAMAQQQRPLPLAATCLRPFAFLPYKAVGRTWVDDWNLQRQHMPMIAAAGSWIERRKVQLPDFDFMSQAYRPLPTAYSAYGPGSR